MEVSGRVERHERTWRDDCRVRRLSQQLPISRLRIEIKRLRRRMMAPSGRWPGWNGIGRRRVRDHVALAIDVNFGGADGQALADLEQAALRNQHAGHGLAEEIDVEAGGNGKWYPADGSQDGDVNADVGQRHDGRTRQRAA